MRPVMYSRGSRTGMSSGMTFNKPDPAQLPKEESVFATARKKGGASKKSEGEDQHCIDTCLDGLVVHSVVSAAQQLRAERRKDNNKTGNGVKVEVWLFLSSVTSTTGVRRWAHAYELFSIGVIVFTILLDVLQSMKDFRHLTVGMANSFFRFNLFVLFVLTSEWLLRLWSCIVCDEYGQNGSFQGRLKFVSRPLHIVDLLVLIAFYTEVFPQAFAGTDEKYLKGLKALRMIRLLRIFALVKISESKSNSFSLVYMVLLDKKQELMATLSIAVVLMLVSATLMYYLEHDAQPNNFSSIPEGMWWSVTALTTVGYGDIYPITPGGRILACIVAFFGIGIFALPAGILGSGFVDVMQQGVVDDEKKILEQEKEEEQKLNAIEGEVTCIRKQVDQMADDVSKILAALKSSR
eukprot:gnl/TRDRNA2_/TRDRNA2_141471_c0_seq1.p1 gnl/TRDRNA2_/TRDRNA2_141471_c0~~gnl/TRDRNA2_/TRDRNA2_141471_c0_seq1.p1  ORF type:complete len:450 (+),score=69.82 gnl/TRDRNA2_/TRDRNA2_141471_c0_seq1:131-1351(+)